MKLTLISFNQKTIWNESWDYDDGDNVVVMINFDMHSLELLQTCMQNNHLVVKTFIRKIECFEVIHYFSVQDKRQGNYNFFDQQRYSKQQFWGLIDLPYELYVCWILIKECGTQYIYSPWKFICCIWNNVFTIASSPTCLRPTTSFEKKYPFFFLWQSLN